MRARDLFLVPATLGLTVVGLWWGGRWSYVAVRNRAPAEMTCAEFAAHRPSAEWVRLTDCDADLVHIGTEAFTQTYGKTNATITESTDVFIPLRPRGVPRSAPASVLIVAADWRVSGLGVRSVSEAEEKRVQASLDAATEGLIELRVDRSERSRKEIHDLGLRLSDDFVILELDETPEPLALSLGMLAMGLGGFGLIARRVRRRMKRRPPPLAKAIVVSG